MTRKHLIFLLLTLLLIFPIITNAQTLAADKSWNPFWKSFSAAVSRKSKTALKVLTASARDFSSGDGNETPSEWLNLVERRNWWSLLQKSVKAGTKPYDYDGRPSRITADNHLVFVYIGRRWRFVGPMGD